MILDFFSKYVSTENGWVPLDNRSKEPCNHCHMKITWVYQLVLHLLSVHVSQNDLIFSNKSIYLVSSRMYDFLMNWPVFLFFFNCDIILVLYQPANAVNSDGAPYTKVWTSGHISGDTSSYLWATGPVVTHNVDLSRAGTHLALDVDLQLHQYSGSSDRMGALCELGKSFTVMAGKQLLKRNIKSMCLFFSKAMSKANISINSTDYLASVYVRYW